MRLFSIDIDNLFFIVGYFLFLFIEITLIFILFLDGGLLNNNKKKRRINKKIIILILKNSNMKRLLKQKIKNKNLKFPIIIIKIKNIYI